MSAKWTYPATATLKVNNTVDSNGYIITDATTGTAQKTISLKGYKTPTDNEDANAATSAYRAVTTVIYGLFGLQTGLILSTGVSQANATIDGDFE